MSATALLAGACQDGAALPRPLAGADPSRGREIAERVACAACHDIPDISWPRGRMGGSLAGFASRPLIAGRFPNQPDVLVRWITDAPAMAPDTGMPPQPLDPDEVRDVAAWLYTLR